MNDLKGIAEVATEYGIKEEQLRYWDRLGILVPQRVGAFRYYGPEEITKLEYLRRLMAQGLRPSEIQLALAVVSFVEGPSISQTKALAQMVKNAIPGQEVDVPFGLNQYNTVYRRAERIAKRNKRTVKIRTNDTGTGLKVQIIR